MFKGLTIAAAVATTAGLSMTADAARVVGTQQVYYNSAGQRVANDTTNYTARDNGDGTFLVNVANILKSNRTELTGVYFESGFADLVSGGPAVAFMEKTPAPATVFATPASASFALGSDSAIQPQLIDWTGSALSVTSAGLGSGLNNDYRVVMTFSYAQGVDFSDVEALLGGYGYRIASLIEDRGGVSFASTSGPTSNPDALSGDGNVTAVPTPSAFAAGLGLLGLAGLKRRREEA